MIRMAMMIKGKINPPKSQISIIFINDVCGKYSDTLWYKVYETSMLVNATMIAPSKCLKSMKRVNPAIMIRHKVGM